MATKIEIVVEQALRCFTRRNKALPDTLQNDMVVLKNLVDEVTSKDVKLLRYLLQKSEQEDSRKPKSNIEPVDYLRIYDNSDVSIGVFILKQGAKLPIHDHPCMFGILKVLQGAIKLTNYSITGMDKNIPAESRLFFHQYALKVNKHPEMIITEKDGCSTLTPTERSIHEVECVTGPAAFLDILAPPYEEENASTPRGCHYFKEHERQFEDGDIRLVQIAEPEYWVKTTESK